MNGLGHSGSRELLLMSGGGTVPRDHRSGNETALRGESCAAWIVHGRTARQREQVGAKAKGTLGFFIPVRESRCSAVWLRYLEMVI